MSDGLRELAVTAAVEAGELLAGFAARLDALVVDTKESDTDPVSEADRSAERRIAERLMAARPDDGLLGEEDQASRRGTTGLRWVVDPLDGTVNFLYGLPAWCVSVAVEDADGGLAGAVCHPPSGEVFHAARGGGAAVRVDGVDTPLSVSAVDDLAHTMVATGFAYDRDVRADWARDVADLLGVARDVRRCGAAALDLAWTAAGRVDAYVEHDLKPWDWAAGRLLVAEAGGTVTDVARTLGGRQRHGLVAGGLVAHDALRAWHDTREAGAPA